VVEAYTRKARRCLRDSGANARGISLSIAQVSLLMHRMGGGVPPASSTVPRAGESIQIGMSGQETPSESSEADSSECDTTGDEDGWESGESSASLVVKRHSHLHGISHDTHAHAHHRANLGGAAKESLPRGDRDKRASEKPSSIVSIGRSSGFLRSSTLDI
jgi:hypothetical protein